MGRMKVLKRFFAPRQIIVSTAGQPKHFNISRGLQITTAAGGFSVFAVIAGLSIYSNIQNAQLDMQEERLALLQEKIRTVSSNLLYARSNLALTKSELNRQYARLEDILTQRKNLASTLQAATANLKQKSSDLNSRDQYARDLEGRIAMLSDKLQAGSKRSEGLSLKISQLNKVLYKTTEERDLQSKERATTQKQLSLLNRDLKMFQSSKDQIYKELQVTKRQLTVFKTRRAENETSIASLREQVSGLKSRISTISVENKDLIARVHAQASQGINALKETITLTGLDPDDVLAMDNIDGVGGPFQSLSNAKDLLNEEQRYYDDAQKMEASLLKWSNLNTLMKNIPLARPLDGGYITSRFGKRRDPVRGKTAFHAGMDISGPKNSSILATAPGKVIFSGRSGAYGLMVQIDHGQGFVTKYGHMKKLTVKKGQIVDFRTKIGVMGSTGRSTGRHVHYEILYNKKNQNPAKFFKAGNYAFKTSSVSDGVKTQ